MASHRILVIEDEPGAREALESLLVEEGYTVATAGSGATGLQRLREFRPDTVVCDFRLPDTDGLDVLRHVRAEDGSVTFIVVTADCGGEDAERLLRSEADFFFQKPVDLGRLRNVLQQDTRGHRPAWTRAHN
ncbi:MAG: sigma-54-dependent transcriptional response regulator [Gemmatimonadetes bacterium]|nr:sigma-54-dependent transcriptional response regulator [Gemmatimonadota bacterium]